MHVDRTIGVMIIAELGIVAVAGLIIVGGFLVILHQHYRAERLRRWENQNQLARAAGRRPSYYPPETPLR
jgi:hypothetical protein